MIDERPRQHETSARIGTVDELRAQGRLTGKLGAAPVVVFWTDDGPRAVEDRCPHMGFPLHRGTVADGLLTCHWHHARFDLASGCALDLWADDARAFDVSVDGDDVWVSSRDRAGEIERLERRLEEGLQESLLLVIAKSVHGLLARGVPPARIVEVGLAFGAANRAEGWGPGMTVAQIVLNLLPHLPAAEHARALTQGLAFLARDTRGHGPFFAVAPLDGAGDSAEPDDGQLARWYRRFVETRSAQAAERTLATAVRPDRVEGGLDTAERFMFAACTDHVYLDEGHIIDFTNKAFEAIEHLGPPSARRLLPTLVSQTAHATRHEELSAWREPVDLVPIAAATTAALRELVDDTAAGLPASDVGTLGRALIADDAQEVTDALVDAASRGATSEQLARAVALAAALRLVHFHVQNEVSDWDTVHHTFTTANAVHQAVRRRPTPELLAGVVQGAMRVYLDRFLNVPAARLPARDPRDLADLDACWEARSGVDEAGAIVAGHLAAGGAAAEVIAALCEALYREDAGFHWFQSVDAAVSQHAAWPEGSEEGALVLVGATRWLVAHTPTLRETEQVVTITRRLLRGEDVHESDAESTADSGARSVAGH